MKNFLDKLFHHIRDDQYIELRCIPLAKGQVPHSSFYHKTEIESLVSMAMALDAAKKYHICTGVLPRNMQSGVKESVSTLQAFWVDIDAKTETLEEIFNRIQKFKLEPTFVVNSGNGFHCYWVLDKLYELDTDTIVEHSKNLHSLLMADKTHDAPRVLRTPGSLNCKDLNSIKPCRILKKNDKEHSLADMIQWMEDLTTEAKLADTKVEEDPTQRVYGSPRTTCDGGTSSNPYVFTNWTELQKYLPGFLTQRIIEMPLHLRDEHGEKLDRSKNDFYVTASLLELGFTKAQIMVAFQIFRDNGFAAGEKFKEKGNDYLTGYTIPAAKEKVPFNIQELLQLIEGASDPSEAMELGEKALRIVQNTRAEEFVVRIHESMKVVTGIDKKNFGDFAEGILSGGGAYIFETYKYGGQCRPNHKKLAEAVILDNPYIRIGSELYRYSEGYYALDENASLLCSHLWAISENRPVGSIIGMEYVKLSARTWVALKQRDIQEIVAYVKQNARPVNLADDVIYPNLICVKNGMLNWRTKVLTKHDPKYLRLSQLDADYLKEAKSTRLEKFVSETFHEQDIKCIWEYMGVTIAPDITAKNFMIYVGSGDNGKSVWLNTVRNVLGSNNISSATLEDLAENRFTKSVLIGKVANIAADISGRGLEDISSIKELTGNDQTSADRKFQSQVTFVNRASLMFSCNILPEAHSADDAYFRRLMITDCPNQVPLDQQDRLLEKKLCTEESKSAWLNLALEGLERYHNNSRMFTESEVMDNILNDHKKDCRPDIAFVDQYLVEETGAFITLEDIIKKFKYWANSYGEMVAPSRGTIKSLILKKFPKQKPVMRERGLPGYQGLTVDESQMLEDLNIPEQFSVKVKEK